MKLTREEIINVESRLIEGIRNSDVKLLDTVLHDDLLFIAPNGVVITKQTDLASHQAHEMIVEKLISTIEEIKIIDDTAVVIVVYNTKGIMLGNPVEGQFRYIRIWKLFSDGLKVIGGQLFSIKLAAGNK